MPTLQEKIQLIEKAIAAITAVAKTVPESNIDYLVSVENELRNLQLNIEGDKLVKNNT